MEIQKQSTSSFTTNLSLLYDVVLKGNVNSFHRLLEEDSIILDQCMIENSNSSFIQSPLHVAACMGHIDIIKTLLEMKPSMYFTQDRYGRTPLHVAACNGRTEALKQLLDLADDVVLLNAKDCYGNTILHYAVRRKQHEMVKLILEDQRIDINAVNKEKLTALDTHILLNKTREGHRHKSCLGKVMNWKNGDEIGPSLEDAKALRAKDAHKNKHKDDWVETQSNGLMVAASLIATMAFAIGISPPGGSWQDNDEDKDNRLPDHEAGVGILYTMAYYFEHNDPLYEKMVDVLLIANAIALGSSLSVVLLLISGLPNCRAMVLILRAIMWIAVSATTLTYAISIFFVCRTSSTAFYYTPLTTVYIWAGLVALVLLTHLVLFVLKFIIRRRTLRSQLINPCDAISGLSLPCSKV